ncbi:PKD domain-containing protein [Sungkyunkwania multivorans]|uniref:PKD domain-containing protein n=1 Tax=Sungkyunkwania multivorans TaxID=1173618 RepID=A0ABW3CYH5_9FLAO
MNHHLDKNVIIFFLMVMLASATAFTYKFIDYEPCEEVVMEVPEDELRVGDVVRFKDNTANVKDRVWNFGDSTDISKRITPSHIYKKPGEYQVTLTVNGKCEAVKLITIREKPFVLDSSKLARFDIPETIKLGTVLKVEDETPNSVSREWRFGETASVNSTDKVAEYTYATPGLKTILLVVNGDVKHSTKKKLNVLPVEKPKEKVTITKIPTRKISGIKEAPKDIKDAPSTPVAECTPISTNSMKSKLILLSQNKLGPEAFKPYLNGDLNLSVVANKKKMTFIELCEKIRDKKIKIKSLFIDKGDNKCVRTMTINYSRTGLF